MTRLVDFPDEVWQVLIPLLMNRHYARLALTGDTRLQAQLRSIRGRHFDVPPHMHTLAQSSIDFMVVSAASLVMASTQLSQIVVHPSLFNSLVKLSLRDDEAVECATFDHTDFTPFVSLHSLEISRYKLVAPLTLPLSICTLWVSFFDIASDGATSPEPLVRNLGGLKCLTELYLRSQTAHRFDLYPPNLTSLYMSVAGADLPLLPDTLLSLGVKSAFACDHVDVHRVVTHHCPRLTSLLVEGNARVGDKLPEGLARLVVTGTIHPSESDSLRVTAERLPHTLRQLYLGKVSGRDVSGALQLLLPRLDFASADDLCRGAMDYSQDLDDDAVGECIVNYLTPWLGNVRYMAQKYLQIIKIANSRTSRSNFLIPRRLEMEDLDAVVKVAVEASSPVLVRHLLTKRPIWHRQTDCVSERHSSVCLTMLELGAINHFCGLGDGSGAHPKLSDAAVRNVVELNLRSRHYKLSALEELLQNNVLYALGRITIGPSEMTFNGVVLLLHRYRTSLPRLEWLEWHCLASMDSLKTVASREAIAALAEMKLYERSTPSARAGCISIAYRVHPPTTTTPSAYSS